MDPEQLFADVVTAVQDEPGVSGPDEADGRHFGAGTLRVHDTIFAMLINGALVVKLPADRVAASITNGTGEPFGTTASRPFREWLTVVGHDAAGWEAFAREACAFVRALPPRRRR